MIFDTFASYTHNHIVHGRYQISQLSLKLKLKHFKNFFFSSSRIKYYQKHIFNSNNTI